MGALELRAVPPGESSPERSGFDALPGRVYETLSAWSPASTSVGAGLLADADSGATYAWPVVVVRDDEVVARAAAVLDPPGVDPGTRRGWIALVECLEDAHDAALLAIDACREWLVVRGAGQVVGPGSSPLLSGLLTGGFDRPQTFLTPYNPPRYRGLWAAAGFVVTTEMLSVEFTRERAPTFHGPRPRGVRVRAADPDRLDDDLAAIGRFQSSVFRGRPGHEDRSLAQMQRLLGMLRPGLDPDLVLLAEDEDGATVGVLACLADAWQRDPPNGVPDRARLLTVGVSEGWRGRSVAMAMGRELRTVLLDKGYRVLEGGWILRENHRSQALARALGARVSRRFALLAVR
jgi:GNAT superfamily N-acetyltransferase